MKKATRSAAFCVSTSGKEVRWMSLSLRSLPWTEPLLDRHMGQAGLYRNEWKYLISEAEAALLRERLAVYLQPDGNARNGQYMI